MLIGQLAQQSGIPAKTLRYYETAGVLAAPARTPGGYRDYGDDALDRLRFVRSAQSAGFTLAEIRSIIDIRGGGAPPCSHVSALLEDKAAAVTHQISQLRRLQRQLDQLRQRAEVVDPAACDPNSVCEVLAPHP